MGYPEINSYVIVEMDRLSDMGAYVKLLNYKNMGGMIQLSYFN
jgi:translation initiation factor 2 alpha subunit (eIF-2alpha)